jgi:hypothetical protein
MQVQVFAYSKTHALEIRHSRSTKRSVISKPCGPKLAAPTRQLGLCWWGLTVRCPCRSKGRAAIAFLVFAATDPALCCCAEHKAPHNRNVTFSSRNAPFTRREPRLYFPRVLQFQRCQRPRRIERRNERGRLAVSCQLPRPKKLSFSHAIRHRFTTT